jgi:hypothetical protein
MDGQEPRTTRVLRAVVVPVTKVTAGPMSEDEAAGIAGYGGLTGYAAAIQKPAAS